MRTRFAGFLLEQPGRVPMPIAAYVGLQMTGASVRDALTSATAQAEAVLALHERFRTPVMLTAMDLSAEAEAFGCRLRTSDGEIPTVVGRRVTSASDLATLPDPQPGDARTGVHLEAAGMLAARANGVPVLGGTIGPFSLAARLFGVSEALELTLSDPELMLALLERTTRLLVAYARAFRDAGASGVILAEPAAGLLSPRGLAQFSAAFVGRIVAETESEGFTVVYHNCGARLVHLPAILGAGVEVCHFGAPMDVVSALDRVDGAVVLCGNLDPTAVFHGGTPEQVADRTGELLQATARRRNFVISSGCDLPPGTPLANLERFYETVGTWRPSANDSFCLS
jgi:uroporphyrinogen decarboxylase